MDLKATFSAGFSGNQPSGRDSYRLKKGSLRLGYFRISQGRAMMITIRRQQKRVPGRYVRIREMISGRTSRKPVFRFPRHTGRKPPPVPRNISIFPPHSRETILDTWRIRPPGSWDCFPSFFPEYTLIIPAIPGHSRGIYKYSFNLFSLR
jgi:hypothetical protein